MSALGTPVLINTKRAYWLSSIGTDVIHSTIVVDELDANTARISTLIAENITASTMNVSTLNFENSDVSGMYVSSIRGNSAFFSTLNIASDLSGGVGYVRFSVDASGIQVDGDPIRFDNLVYLTSTINIVQVSTLVDTDIFSQNGFFSTLSSGSISTGLLNARQAYLSSVVCEDISGTNGTFDRLFVSSLEAIDISGVASGKNWSLYPTLNSSITFQPGNVLSNVGNQLYFAGRELTDVSGGGNDWSIYPAYSTVQIANNSLTGISTLFFQDGGRLTSLTGNNLQYNGQNITVGGGGNAANWAQYPANANVNINGSNLSNVNGISGSNLALSGSNITNGNTFTNSLGVGGLSLLPIASITSGGDISCRNLDVGDSTTSLADVAIYGVNALPGDNALYVIGGTTLTGGLTAGVPVHGTEIGALPLAGIDTVRIDVLPAGMGFNSATYIQLAAAGAGSFAAGGALSLAGGDYVEVNTDDFRVINTTSGNQSTTLTVANIQMPPSVASVPLQINNTNGGINLVGASGKGQIAGFSTIAGDAMISPLLSTINVNLSTINGVPLSQIQTPSDIVCSTITSESSFATTSLVNFFQVSTMIMGNGLILSTTIGDLRANNIKVADDITGVTNAPMPLESRIINFSSINSFAMSTTDLYVSSINGAAPGGGGGGPTVSTFDTAQASTFHVSTLRGFPNFGAFSGSTINVETGLQFVGQAGANPGTGRWISSLRAINDIGEDFEVIASTMFLNYASGINSNGFIRVGGGAFNDTIFKEINGIPGISTATITAVSSIASEFTVSTIKAPGGLPIKLNNALEFTFPDGINNVDVINTNPPSIPELAIGASTIVLDTNNTRTISFSTLEGTVSSLYSRAAVIENLSSAIASVSTFQFVDQSSTIGAPIQSSFLNVAMGYDLSGTVQFAGISIENYVNSVDNLDFFIVGNADGATIKSWTNYRSSLSELFIAGNSVDIGVDISMLVSDNNSNDFTEIGPTFISTQALAVSSINDYDARPALTNNLMLSTMTLYAGSTTLMYWDSTTTSDNINTSGYDVVVGVNGNYKIGTSFQFLETGAPTEVEFFILKNDTVISQSGGIQEVTTNQELITYFEGIERLVNGDKIQIGCFTNGATLTVSTINGNVIQSPAAILTMYKVD